MRTLAFDGRMGASGDMLLGALLAAGASPAALDPIREALDVEFQIATVDRQGIAATDVTVVHGDTETLAEGHGPHRTLAEVEAQLEAIALPSAAHDDAMAIFERIARAEAAVHGTDPAETHFHEVGADDAIADVVGAVLLLDDLDVERVVVGPVSAGEGEVSFSHGTYPVPTPAVIEILERSEIEVVGGPVSGELLTPTGAAVLAELAEGVSTIPPLQLDTSGYGAGDRSVEGRPNVLRALVGTTRDSLAREEITVLETNLDDVTPEVLGHLQESLADAGALDVSVIPVTMKKSRPGHLVRVVVPPVDAERVAHRLAEETGTLGIRNAGASHRWIADRELRTVDLDIDGSTYSLTVKIARDLEDRTLDYSAEFEDARRVARETGHPVREIIARAEAIAREETD